MSAQMKERYARVMGKRAAAVLDGPGPFTLRLWVDAETAWRDISAGIPLDEALRAWADHTHNGTCGVSFLETDYFRIFPSHTRMKLDGAEGQAALRQAEGPTSDPPAPPAPGMGARA